MVDFRDEDPTPHSPENIRVVYARDREERTAHLQMLAGLASLILIGETALFTLYAGLEANATLKEFALWIPLVGIAGFVITMHALKSIGADIRHTEERIEYSEETLGIASTLYVTPTRGTSSVALLNLLTLIVWVVVLIYEREAIASRITHILG